MITLIWRLVRWGITRNLLRTSFLLLTVIGLVTSLAITGAMMYDLANQTIETWRAIPFDIRVTGSMVGGLKERVSSLNGVRQVEQVVLLPLVLGARQIEAAVQYQADSLLDFTFSDGRAPASEDEIAIDSSLARDTELGNTIKLAAPSQLEHAVSYKVCGISNNALTYCLLTEAGAERALPEFARYSTLLVLLDPSASSRSIEQSIRAMSTGMAIRNYDEAQNYDYTLNISRRLISITRALLLVAGLGGFYILTSLSLRERTRELGALRAVGFGKARIALFLLLEACSILVLGTALAFAGALIVNGWLGLGNWHSLLSDNIGAAQTVMLLGLVASLVATLNVLHRPAATLIKE